METITVKTWTGEREMTRDEFVGRWLDQVGDLWAICYSTEDHEIAARIRDDLEYLAFRAFDTLYQEKVLAGEVA